MLLNSIYHKEIPLFISDFFDTEPMQRLKTLGMDCGCEYTNFPAYRHCIKYNRLEHSLGVALIIWHFTGDRKQTIAGLLHDISTPVFSHTVDFLNKDYLLQESTESDTAAFITKSEQIMQLLDKYALPLEAVCNYHIYPIADNSSPKLSADRLEYTFRKFMSFGLKSLSDIASYYSDLIIGKNEAKEDEIMFNSLNKAEDFFNYSLKNSFNDISDDDRYAMQYLADILFYALNKGILIHDDLYTTEPNVISKIKAVPETKKAWNQFCTFTRTIRSMENSCNIDRKWIRVSSKKRYIDPYVLSQGRVSSVSDQQTQKIKKFLSTNTDYWITAINPK